MLTLASHTKALTGGFQRPPNWTSLMLIVGINVCHVPIADINHHLMSASGGKADIPRSLANVR